MKFAAIGDSIINGYPHENNGWFSELCKELGATSAKLSQNGATIIDALDQTLLLSDDRTDILFIAVGINDIIRPCEKNAAFDISVEKRKKLWPKLFQSMKSKEIKNVVICGLLPVIESLYPSQEWSAREIFVFNQDILNYNFFLEDICKYHGFYFYNPYEFWKGQDLLDLYIDACHLNLRGHGLYAEKLLEYLKYSKLL